MAPKLTRSLMPYLNQLTKDFFEIFINLFPHINPINKMHHVTHYVECILWSGPMLGYFSARFEAKHSTIKQRAQNVHNFKNPAKTLIKICQCSQSSKWGAGDVSIDKQSCAGGSVVQVQETSSVSFLYDLEYIDTDEVFKTKSIRLNGVEFRLGLFVCLEAGVMREDNLHQFAKIIEILVLEGKSFILTCPALTTHFDSDLHAFGIELGSTKDLLKFVPIKSLAHYKPVCPWTESVSDGLYISMRHILL